MRPVDLDLLRGLPLPDTDAGGKDERGAVLIVAGGEENPGAALLAGHGALRAGAGKLKMAAGASWAPHLRFAMPEARVIAVAATRTGDFRVEATDDLVLAARKSDAVVIGPGMMDKRVAPRIAQRLMALNPKAAFVIDAAAFTGLPLAPSQAPCVLTPHPGEMAALFGVEREAIAAAPENYALRAAKTFDAVVALKSRLTHIAAPDGALFVHDNDRAPGLGTCGSGDVLAGVIGGLLARGAEPLTATLWGVFAHANAGALLCRELGPLGLLARELPGKIPQILREISSSSAPRR